jgi:hypothetical protein
VGRSGSQAWLYGLWVALVGYAAFTAVLFGSTREDAQAGRAFAANTLLLLAAGVLYTFGRVRASTTYFLGAAGQMAVLGYMLARDIGDLGVVLPLNLGVALAFAVLGGLARRREARPADPPPSH